MRRLVVRSDNWLALGSQTGCPGKLTDIGLSLQKFAVGAVQHVEEAVAIGLNHQLARFAFPHGIDQRGWRHGVEVMHVMGRELEVPLQPASLWIERHDRVGIEIIASSIISDQIWAGIADGPVE